MTWGTRRGGWTLLWLLLAALALSACGEGEAEREAALLRRVIPRRVDAAGRVHLEPPERRALDLRTATATAGVLWEVSHRYGTVVAPPGARRTIAAPVAARLEPLLQPLAAGDPVSPGTILARLVPTLGVRARAELEARVRTLDAEREQIRARIEAQRAIVAARQALLASRLTERVSALEAEAQLEALRARARGIDESRATLRDALRGELALRSPVAGTLLSLRTDAGAELQAGERIGTVLAQGPRWVLLRSLPEDEVADAYRVRTAAGSIPARWLRRGADVAPDGFRHDRLVLSPPTATARLPAVGDVVPVEVRRRRKGLRVAASAVVPLDGAPAVFVETEPGVYAPVRVRVTARAGDVVLVERKRRPGSAPPTGPLRVVVRGAMALRAELGRAGWEGRRGDEAGPGR
ncbi:MAG: hypothetical protein D6776_03655 [Planctomycetota bacterium]|nr:MAG: hypothetical protein D6776_03655 [Planctomycetota bacterium]